MKYGDKVKRTTVNHHKAIVGHIYTVIAGEFKINNPWVQLKEIDGTYDPSMFKVISKRAEIPWL
jgi:hypothetical protein